MANRTTWLLIAGFAVVFAAVALLAFDQTERGDPEQEVVIDMTVSRYEFTPGSQEPLRVSQGDVVVLRVTSTDVTHGFAITEYGINRELPPGETVEIRFRAEKPGEFLIYCTVFCGVGHPEHKGTLHVA